ncbi:MAG: type I pantothenate kinase [Candidatus Binatia bacterium]
MTGDPARAATRDLRRSPSLSALAALIEDRLAARPLLVGIAGPEAVGKTTLVHALRDALTQRGRTVQVLSTDAFLLANAVLEARGLALRKGFPESYDATAIGAALATLHAGGAAQVPAYSHAVYDVVPDRVETIAAAQVVLVEGVVALQPPAAAHLDLAIYVDAAEDAVREWFVARFARLTAAAASDATSFYRPFAALPPEQVRAIAVATWDAINAPNLRQHIAPSAARADVVVCKDAAHGIVELRLRELGSPQAGGL